MLHSLAVNAYPCDKDCQDDREKLKHPDFANVRQGDANVPHVLQIEQSLCLDSFQHMLSLIL